MTTAGEHEEAFREAACNGDTDSLIKLLEVFGVDINSSNKINGWTALHWASKRNHKPVIELLLQKGADKDKQSNQGEKPVDLTTNKDILEILGATPGQHSEASQPSLTTFTPNYLANPVFPYTQPVLPVSANTEENITQINNHFNSYAGSQNMPGVGENEVVLKIRVAYLDDRDFIEVEMDKSNLTYEALKSVMCKELGIERRLINKIRKLPNTILRKDKDVQRLHDFQELEVILTNKVPTAAMANRGFASPLKNQEVLY